MEPIIASFIDGTRLDYYLIFPRELAGRKYALLLTDEAKLAAPEASPGVTYGDQADDTQAFTGTVPSPTQASDAERPSSLGCSDLFGTVAGYFTAHISGRSENQVEQSWPYEIESFPFFYLSYSSATSPGSLVETSRLCQQMKFPTEYEPLSVNPGPQAQIHEGVAWSGNQNAPNVMLRRSDAEPIANASIILAGVAFAVTAGFLPMWVENRAPRNLGARLRRRWRGDVERR